ncbi:MAG: hypothetical protein ACFB0B_17640 [Thermonemataceae bacterium]
MIKKHNVLHGFCPLLVILLSSCECSYEVANLEKEELKYDQLEASIQDLFWQDRKPIVREDSSISYGSSRELYYNLDSTNFTVETIKDRFFWQSYLFIIHREQEKYCITGEDFRPPIIHYEGYIYYLKSNFFYLDTMDDLKACTFIKVKLDDE